VRIPRALYDELVDHARSDPNEVCGLIAGRDGLPTRLLPVRNAAASSRHYEMDGAEQHRAYMDIEDAGEDLVAIYHSHPEVGSYFSETDLRLAYMPDGETLAWPGVIYIVVGLEPFAVRAFDVADQVATEVELAVV
jgi:proteasome lid subunit RPN8/RPN11